MLKYIWLDYCVALKNFYCVTLEYFTEQNWSSFVVLQLNAVDDESDDDETGHQADSPLHSTATSSGAMRGPWTVPLCPAKIDPFLQQRLASWHSHSLRLLERWCAKCGSALPCCMLSRKMISFIHYCTLTLQGQLKVLIVMWNKFFFLFSCFSGFWSHLVSLNISDEGLASVSQQRLQPPDYVSISA